MTRKAGKLIIAALLLAAIFAALACYVTDPGRLFEWATGSSIEDVLGE